MEAAVADYVALAASVGGELKEADWSKVRGLEFREALQERDELQKKLEFLTVEEEDLGEPVRWFPSFACITRLTQLASSTRSCTPSGLWRTRSHRTFPRLCATGQR